MNINPLQTLDRAAFIPPMQDKPVINPEEAMLLESVFKILANATRLRILHALIREPNLTVNALADAIGMKAQAVSNQLRRLSDRGIVAARRKGTRIHYSIIDGCTISLLERGFCLAVCTESEQSEPTGELS